MASNTITSKPLSILVTVLFAVLCVNYSFAAPAAQVAARTKVDASSLEAKRIAAFAFSEVLKLSEEFSDIKLQRFYNVEKAESALGTGGINYFLSMELQSPSSDNLFDSGLKFVSDDGTLSTHQIIVFQRPAAAATQVEDSLPSDVEISAVSYNKKDYDGIAIDEFPMFKPREWEWKCLPEGCA